MSIPPLPALAYKTQTIQITAWLTPDDLPGTWIGLIDPIIRSQIDESTLAALTCIISVEQGERSKTVENLRFLMQAHHDVLAKADGLIVIGGGSAINLATALAAEKAKINPGGSYVIVPTTFLAMVDVAYGSLGLLNENGLKNKFRCVFDPTAIVLDESFLHALPVAEIKRGLAESLKHALLQDDGSTNSPFPTVQDCLLCLKNPAPATDLLVKIVHQTLCAKAAIITAKHDGNGTVENLLSYGHVDAEPRESASGFQLSHGDAVLLGLAIELALCGPRDLYQAVIQAIPHTPLAQELSKIDFDAGTLREAYRTSGKPRFALGHDTYRVISLARQGAYALLDPNTTVGFVEISFDALYDIAKGVLCDAMALSIE